MLFNFRLFKPQGRRKHSFKSPPKMSSMVHFNPRADAWQYYGDVVFLAVSTLYFIRAITPPFKATKEERARAQGRDVLSRLGLTNIVLPVQVFAVCIAVYTSKAILERGFVGQGAVVSRLMFWTGNALVTLGSMRRLACHRELGRFFTFDLAVTKGHKVRSSSPERGCRCSVTVRLTDCHPTSGATKGHPIRSLRLRPSPSIHGHTDLAYRHYTSSPPRQPCRATALERGGHVPQRCPLFRRCGESPSTLCAHPHLRRLLSSLFGPFVSHPPPITALWHACLQWLIYRRISDEEAMLQRELGPEYKQYMKR